MKAKTIAQDLISIIPFTVEFNYPIELSFPKVVLANGEVKYYNPPILKFKEWLSIHQKKSIVTAKWTEKYITTKWKKSGSIEEDSALMHHLMQWTSLINEQK